MKDEYDGLIKAVRTEKVPLNRTSLTTYAIKYFVDAHSVNGKPDVKKIVAYIQEERKDVEIARLEAKLAELKKG